MTDLVPIFFFSLSFVVEELFLGLISCAMYNFGTIINAVSSQFYSGNEVYVIIDCYCQNIKIRGASSKF